MNQSVINQLLFAFGNDAFFVGKANEARIKEIELSLNVTLPESYKWFLKYFGHGGVPGVEIFGNGLAEVPSCVKATKEWRKYGLPSSFVVIEDEGTDWIYCLDTSSFIERECPIVEWIQNIGAGKEKYENFYVFFEIRLKDALKST